MISFLVSIAQTFPWHKRTPLESLRSFVRWLNLKLCSTFQIVLEHASIGTKISNIKQLTGFLPQFLLIISVARQRNRLSDTAVGEIFSVEIFHLG